MTTGVLNTKIREVENKIPDTSGLVTTFIFNTKIGEVEINKFAGNIFKMKLKQANQATNCDFNTVTTCSQKQRKN